VHALLGDLHPGRRDADEAAVAGGSPLLELAQRLLDDRHERRIDGKAVTFRRLTDRRPLVEQRNVEQLRDRPERHERSRVTGLGDREVAVRRIDCERGSGSASSSVACSSEPAVGGASSASSVSSAASALTTSSMTASSESLPIARLPRSLRICGERTPVTATRSTPK
jgi:hypothetical protein